MGNIVKWFSDFPSRALLLWPDFESAARKKDLVGSLSLLIAPALIIAPYERLQTYSHRMNPEEDYLRFPDKHREFDQIMRSPFGKASFWRPEDMPALAEWKCAQVSGNIGEPSSWKNVNGIPIGHDEFWSDEILGKETRWVWRVLRDSLAHWNVVTSDRNYQEIRDHGTMEKLLFYRSIDERKPWDTISVPPETFFRFLTAWATFLSRETSTEILAATAA